MILTFSLSSPSPLSLTSCLANLIILLTNRIQYSIICWDRNCTLVVLVVISVKESEAIQTLIKSSQILLTCFISRMITTSVEMSVQEFCVGLGQAHCGRFKITGIDLIPDL